jgi:hypothetical protein
LRFHSKHRFNTNNLTILLGEHCFRQFCFRARHNYPVVHGEARDTVGPHEDQHGSDNGLGLSELKVGPNVVLILQLL